MADTTVGLYLKANQLLTKFTFYSICYLFQSIFNERVGGRHGSGHIINGNPIIHINYFIFDVYFLSCNTHRMDKRPSQHSFYNEY